jgi:hypothetical protein
MRALIGIVKQRLELRQTGRLPAEPSGQVMSPAALYGRYPQPRVSGAS